MGFNSEVPPDPNLALTRHVGPTDLPSSPGHFESSFFGAEEEHHDPADRCGSSFPDDSNSKASSSGSDLNLSAEPESLLQFFVKGENQC